MLSGSKRPLENKASEESTPNKRRRMQESDNKSRNFKKDKYINLPSSFKPNMLTLVQIQEMPHFVCLPQQLLLLQDEVIHLNSS